MEAVAQLLIWLNALANALGRVLLAPVAWLPGWLSATLAAVATGLAMLYAFKYTSNQRAIKRVRNDIKANLLALKLFKESPAVTLRAQGRVFLGAGKLMLLAVVPMLVMALPACLVLGQLALWYQARPLRVGEEALVEVRLGENAQVADVALAANDAVEPVIGPVRDASDRAVYWKLKAKAAGQQTLTIQVGAEEFPKELVVGDGFMRTSVKRPDHSLTDLLLHPAERPFAKDAPVRSIAIEYPARKSWTSGTDAWVAYWFIVSMVAAFIGRPWLNVQI